MEDVLQITIALTITKTKFFRTSLHEVLKVSYWDQSMSIMHRQQFNLDVNSKTIGQILKGTATVMITMFYMKDLINHEFWYQFHLNRLKNVEVVGVWIFANGL